MTATPLPVRVTIFSLPALGLKRQVNGPVTVHRTLYIAYSSISTTDSSVKKASQDERFRPFNSPVTGHGAFSYGPRPVPVDHTALLAFQGKNLTYT